MATRRGEVNQAEVDQAIRAIAKTIEPLVITSFQPHHKAAARAMYQCTLARQLLAGEIGWQSMQERLKEFDKKK